MMKRKSTRTLLLAALTALLLTGCGLRKPEKHSMINIEIDSITTVCGTDCDIDDIDISSGDTHGTATYVYTNVAGENGIADAQKYHDYLAGNTHCVRIDDFDTSSCTYTALMDVGMERETKDSVKEPVREGFSVTVTFTKDSYTVTIMDNVALDE